MRTHATTALWRPEGEGLLNVVPREDAPMPQDTVGVAGSFEDYESAATAVQELEFAGLHGIEISLVSNDADRKHAKRLDERAKIFQWSLAPRSAASWAAA